MNELETQQAEYLVTEAIDLVTMYYDPDDYDCATVAVLARALEVAKGRTLKPLEEIFE